MQHTAPALTASFWHNINKFIALFKHRGTKWSSILLENNLKLFWKVLINVLVSALLFQTEQQETLSLNDIWITCNMTLTVRVVSCIMYMLVDLKKNIQQHLH